MATIVFVTDFPDAAVVAKDMVPPDFDLVMCLPEVPNIWKRCRGRIPGLLRGCPSQRRAVSDWPQAKAGSVIEHQQISGIILTPNFFREFIVFFKQNFKKLIIKLRSSYL